MARREQLVGKRERIIRIPEGFPMKVALINGVEVLPTKEYILYHKQSGVRRHIYVVGITRHKQTLLGGGKENMLRVHWMERLTDETFGPLTWQSFPSTHVEVWKI